MYVPNAHTQGILGNYCTEARSNPIKDARIMSVTPCFNFTRTSMNISVRVPAFIFYPNFSFDFQQLYAVNAKTAKAYSPYTGVQIVNGFAAISAMPRQKIYEYVLLL